MYSLNEMTHVNRDLTTEVGTWVFINISVRSRCGKIYSPIFYQVDLANAEDLTWLEVTPRDELLWQQFLVTLSNG